MKKLLASFILGFGLLTGGGAALAQAPTPPESAAPAAAAPEMAPPAAAPGAAAVPAPAAPAVVPKLDRATLPG